MDNRQEVREFLVSRRAKISPDRAGLPAGGNRRVPGLRRSEVAMLADVSVEYYAKLERGNLAGVSPAVLDAVARALQLDDAERAHLLALARAADGTSAILRRRPKVKQWSPRGSLQQVLDAVTEGPAFVRNGRMDLLAANRLARAFYSEVYASSQQPPNIARFQFLDPASRRFYPDWEFFADVCVEILHTEAGRNPHDKGLHDLVGELSTRSDEFRRRWSAHNVRHHGTGSKTFHHPVVGTLTLAYEGLELAAEPGLTLTIYTAEPGSPSEEALRLLASWAATQEASTVDRAERNHSSVRDDVVQDASSSRRSAEGEPGSAV
ncbi:helix-turn-helix domain-containing protein [Amycolatopsis mediterranei]|uniref:XRE family transcriptional regulator n=1 Tax=Amycolatopsis mediterranei (strain S699) TaxID=713604 RepID=A0A9R0NXB8_AMYMS|nr:helix-turn-helix transcriptional regulator [Amycolatopsis mediterranei]AEK42280.1 XRE family transcriptional regulator [Amycolatopsis mediterranei S699]KDO06086.1 XRE family transcriptional regulator [Amycolatopsis mediterranei]KDU88773.1 XRE family transcriptional regulator [Amycolatopsis mediterranei]UZF70714.1 helix-turn-helix transcriptional regulator [Amycolatopsis mediterranei]